MKIPNHKNQITSIKSIRAKKLTTVSGTDALIIFFKEAENFPLVH
jgi:hypothetical protein